jgi:hypothetical protein
MMVALALLGGSTALAADTTVVSGNKGGHGVKLTVDSDGHVLSGTIRWRAQCRRPGALFRTGTAFETGVPTVGSFRAGGSYRSRGGGYRFRITLLISGRQRIDPAGEEDNLDEWRGRFRAKAVIRKGGRVTDRCRVKRARWRASADVSEADAAAGTGGVQMTSDPGDYIGQGQSYSYPAPPRSLHASGNPSSIGFTVGPWGLRFSAPTGTTLRAGGYPNAARDAFRGSQPGLSISGQGRGCGRITGYFIVNSISFDRWNRLLAADITFEQHCEGDPEALRGRVVFLRS